MKWIPMSKALPDKYQYVLVSFYENENYKAVNIAYRVGEQWYLRLGEAPITLSLNA